MIVIELVAWYLPARARDWSLTVNLMPSSVLVSDTCSLPELGSTPGPLEGRIKQVETTK